MAPTSPLKEAQALRQQGRTPDALEVLRDALRRGLLDAERVVLAGRMIHQITADLGDAAKPLRLLFLGQFTTSWLKMALTAAGWAGGVPVLVEEGEYDNVLQELMARPPDAPRPDVVVLLPWHQRVLGAAGAASGRIQDELDFWRQVWGVIAERWGTRILQVGYDWMTPGALGNSLGGGDDGDVGVIRTLNQELRRNLPPGAYFLDLDQVAGGMGRDSFYDPRRYHWTKQPFSEQGTRRLADHLWAGVRALTTGPKKVLVVDLDNTLWGGVVGEVGPAGIALGETPDGEAYLAFQRHVKTLAGRGVILAIASKNNVDDAREPFATNPNMALGLEDFSALEISWDPKGTTIKRIAQTLNLGLDTFVFFDDNPVEREQVRQALPDVEVVEVPEDPAEYVRALQAGLWFEAVNLTSEDEARTRHYTAERQRHEVRQSYGTLEDYLGSLEMRAEVRPIDEVDLPRVVQLLAKTNQFNLTTRRHSRDDVLDLINRPRAIAWTLRLRDRFGDYGLVSVMIAVPGDRDETAVIDTWLMSCRVIGRTVEHALFGAFLEECRRRGYGRIRGEYIPTAKNDLVRTLFGDLGFDLAGDAAGTALYDLHVPAARRPTTFVAITE